MTLTWFISGASSGIGRLLTERLLERGDRVAATVRRPDALDASAFDGIRVALAACIAALDAQRAIARSVEAPADI
jgi:NAD(P)-dependent dehydrogenase (short-subunit alcohol dehydrogenase family)